MAQQFEFIGKVIRVKATESREYNGKTYNSRKVWIDDQDEKYPNQVEFEFSGQRCDELNFIEEEMQVKITYNLGGRYWQKEGKEGVFNTLRAWKIEVIQEAQAPAPTPTPPAHNKHTPMAPAPAIPAKQVPVQQPSDQDDLPF